MRTTHSTVHGTTLLAIPVVLATWSGVASPARAVTNLEYGLEYEAQYLSVCNSLHDAAICSCALVRTEETVSFPLFAEAVIRTGGDVFRDQIVGPTAVEATEECGAEHSGHSE